MSRNSALFHAERARDAANSAINELRIDVHDPAPDPVAESGPVVEELGGDAEVEQSWLVVGKGEGEPGSVVHIEVLAASHLPINGFGLAVGCDRDITLTDCGPSADLLGALGRVKLFHIHERRTGASWKENFIQAGVIFMGPVITQEDVNSAITGEMIEKIKERNRGADKTIIDLRIPFLIPIYDLHLRLPPDVNSGTRYELNAEWKYGRRLKNSDGSQKWLNFPTELTRSKGLAIRPSFVSGWIDVI